MAENIDLRSKAAGSGQSRAAPSRRRRGVMRPSVRSINGLLDWIAEAQAVNGTWVGNFLMVLGVLLALLLLASGLGLLPR